MTTRTDEEYRQAQRQLLEESDRLYERYGKPLEAEHSGKLVAITREGKTLLGTDERDLIREATARFGRGSFIFSVGPRYVSKWL
jgi:hypothetical protein